MFRRLLLTRCAAAALAAASLLGLAATAQAQTAPKKVTIAVATTVMNITYPWLMMPQALGYWKQEGLDVQVVPVGASLQVVQQMVGGNAQFGQINSSVVVPANVVTHVPVRVLMANTVIDTLISVPQDSPVKDVTDLKGKNIGVFSLASGAIPLLKSYLSAKGLDPNTDVTLIPVGLGAQPVDALRTGKVQALVYWGAANASFENAGLKLRYLGDPDWLKIPDFSLVGLEKTLETDPQAAIGIGRGAARASLFAMTNPECVRQLQWQNWPSTKPGGVDEATAAQFDLRGLAAQETAMKAAFDLGGGTLWGRTTAEDYNRMQEFMLKTGQIPGTIAPATFLNTIPDYFEKINDFDHAAVIAQAKACRV